MTVKDQVQAVLKELPEDCTMEDVQRRLYVSQKIRQREEQVARGEVVTHEEAKARLQKWQEK